MLVATKNPCPCGYYGDPTRECSCTQQALLQYQKRVSGPLLDRIDMVISVARVSEKDLLSSAGVQQQSPVLRQTVSKARARQHERYGSETHNAELSSKRIAERTLLSEPAKQLLTSAAERMQLSARGYFKVIKVARTIADIEQCEAILPPHIAEALQYRFTPALTR